MTETERRYAQTEKEALAVTWACEKFSNYRIAEITSSKVVGKKSLANAYSSIAWLIEMDRQVKKFGWFKFGERLAIRQICQTFPPPKFLAIRYIY